LKGRHHRINEEKAEALLELEKASGAAVRRMTMKVEALLEFESIHKINS
jgi:hypothetical protein